MGGFKNFLLRGNLVDLAVDMIGGGTHVGGPGLGDLGQEMVEER